MKTELVTPAPFDAIVIGGGPAGLSAALVLGRARKRTLVVDAARPRHAVTDAVHGFLTREGIAPAELRRIGRAQLEPFTTVSFAEATVESADLHDGRITLRLADGRRLDTRALLLAVGVIDEHPELPGYAELWGRSIHICPFCHGWESRDRRVGLYGGGEVAVHKAMLLRTWTRELVVYASGEPVAEAQRMELAAAGIRIEPRPVVALEGQGHVLERVRFSDGQAEPCDVLFVSPLQRPVPLVETLGVRLVQAHPRLASRYVEVDPMMATSLPGVWAAGDCTTPMQTVIEATAQGSRAAAAIVGAQSRPA